MRKSYKKSYKSIRILSKNKSRKMCMDVEGGYTGDNGRIISYPCHNGPNQKFHYNRKTKQLHLLTFQTPIIYKPFYK
jgi:hypothetical protein